VLAATVWSEASKLSVCAGAVQVTITAGSSRWEVSRTTAVIMGGLRHIAGFARNFARRQGSTGSGDSQRG
jgi:hypothetical protein